MDYQCDSCKRTWVSTRLHMVYGWLCARCWQEKVG